MNTYIRPIIIDLVDELRIYPDNWNLVSTNYYYRIQCSGIDINLRQNGLLRISSTTSPETHIELNGYEQELVHRAALDCYNYLRDKQDRENQHKETEFLETALEELKMTREEV